MTRNPAVTAALLVLAASAIPSAAEAPPRAWRPDPWQRRRKYRGARAGPTPAQRRARRKRQRDARRKAR